ncbi:major facilitator superfamily domain-containing protein [Colletotrichum godetiae]|uniref:Major facilitator superfamily domain-containing protein n=1 Tax=Colletotrichum godetiae TaxID=1209918 RepID=A0AAJ0ASJ3_9PEZI|nr:major facilitator superfamily domain-containing protein [Colletotrichum godetiae]KAK1687319.1 major facilitator superfamily domain-containing protein [Colletotrichum godetiae]
MASINPEAPLEGQGRVQVSVYSRFRPLQKRTITAIAAFCGFLAQISTTSVLAAVPEIVATYNTTANVISISNAVYLAFMGLSSFIWGPWADIFGRRSAYLYSLTLFLVFTIGTALAPQLELFFLFRAFTAFQGTSFLILGSSCISDIYHPTERATSLGWFLSGTTIGPAFGPLLGGIVVTFTSWRVIFWIQASLAATALVLVFFCLPETLHQSRESELAGLGPVQKCIKLWQWGNPIRVVKIYGNRNMLLICLASSSLVWNMYSLLTPIRYVLNPRFHLTTPLQSGLLYIAPGLGYVVGCQIGGRWADYTVSSWIRKRGIRLPEDRLRSSLVFLGLMLPGSMVLYGWTLDKRFGGIPLPIICMFLQGIAQLAAFPSLNAYILDVMQHQNGEASASHYLMRYMFAGLATALCLPLIEAIGVGWVSTMSAGIQFICAGLVYLTVRLGEGWRQTHQLPVPL